jgi:hypothetical protein
MGGAQRLPDEIHARHPHQLDLGVQQEPSDELGPPVTAPTYDRGLEPFHRPKV